MLQVTIDSIHRYLTEDNYISNLTILTPDSFTVIFQEPAKNDQLLSQFPLV